MVVAIGGRKHISTRLKPRVNSPSKDGRTCGCAVGSSFSHAFHEPRLVPHDKMMLAGLAGLCFAG